MITINLLPVQEIKRRLQAKRQLMAFGGCLLVLFGVLAAVAVWQTRVRADARRQVQALQDEKQRYDKLLAQVKRLEKRREQIAQYVQVIQGLRQQASLTVHILDEVSAKIKADRMWLTDLEQNGPTLKLSGMALDNRTIANFMDALKQSPYFLSVNLTSSSQKVYADTPLKAFSLTCLVGMSRQGAMTAAQ